MVFNRFLVRWAVLNFTVAILVVYAVVRSNSDGIIALPWVSLCALAPVAWWVLRPKLHSPSICDDGLAEHSSMRQLTNFKGGYSRLLLGLSEVFLFGYVLTQSLVCLGFLLRDDGVLSGIGLLLGPITVLFGFAFTVWNAWRREWLRALGNLSGCLLMCMAYAVLFGVYVDATGAFGIHA